LSLKNVSRGKLRLLLLSTKLLLKDKFLNLIPVIITQIGRVSFESDEGVTSKLNHLSPKNAETDVFTFNK
jgi:hypothetical protein